MKCYVSDFSCKDCGYQELCEIYIHQLDEEAQQ